ncbi:bifunctional peptidase and arginyl-hydroxylase JMJD5 [Drosophila obscura]|uniref:bifunctional peptidase and arginyl-hydroxylase JMJD5 n=1 Tax=Drosophila obscura TaxID=7282 RepID=UPI001BB1B5BD|nr:bifunctional peptidase and arginyl-hydroxylase JMJD5 [Drosophila obscura]
MQCQFFLHCLWLNSGIMEAPLLELFPHYADLEDFLQNEVEARYILKKATDCLERIKKSSRKAGEDEEIRYLICALVDRNWERIHTGHFSSVPLTIRKIYAIACFFKIFFLLLESTDPRQKEKCSGILDEAQLLACTDDWSDLKAALMDYLDKGQETSVEPLPILAAVMRVSSACGIPQLDAPGLNEFQTKCFQAQQPTLLLNTIKQWPAMDKWRDLNYLVQVAGNRTVPIEIGSNYANDEWSQQLVKIRDFLRRQFVHQSEDGCREIEYLAQHELFAQIPALKADICVPDYCTVSGAEEPPAAVDIKAWLGPAGTISPMHYDPKHNLLCQVFGSKQIILAAPKDTDNLYPHESEFLGNTSQINAAELDFKKYPLLEKVRFYKLLLQPGDCLYMPPKWWHYVRAETPSFSVSFWWE